MASVFFPEPMNYLEIVCPLESAYQTVKALSKKGTVQIIDANSGNLSINKRYTENYMQCEEAERNLHYIEHQLQKHGLLPPKPTLEEFNRQVQDVPLIDLIQIIEEQEHSLREKVQIAEQLFKDSSERKKKLQSLTFFKPLIERQLGQLVHDESSNSSVELNILNERSFISSVSGCVPSESLFRMLTTVYRISRGNVVFNTGDAIEGRTYFAIFTTSSNLLARIEKICASFTSDVYQFPSDPEAIDQIQNDLLSLIDQHKDVIEQTKRTNAEFMNEIAQTFWNNFMIIANEKHIFSVMDYGDFNSAESNVIYSGWCPERFVDDLPPILEVARQASGSPLEIHIQAHQPEERPNLDPPSYIETNEFTEVFQVLNNSYGIPNYDEINAGAFYCLYPFYFGIMFGDIGHSMFYLLASLSIFLLHYLTKKGKIDLGETGDSIFKVRYFLLIASLCGMYCGFIYNEFFGLPMDLFGTNYKLLPPVGNSTIHHYGMIEQGRVYPFGIDPVWVFKDNELMYLNSFKMKMSVIVGMISMVFGMFLKLINVIRNRNWTKLFATWIPEMMYLVPFFGYLVVLIIKKWATVFGPSQPDGVNLIQLMINMLLQFGKKDPAMELYPAQWDVQMVILILFVISIPLLLFTNPIIQAIKQRNSEEKTPVVELFVMNLIHVIEFCLGALSHTASFLRLWALSLAHSQLSHVLYEQLFIMGTESKNPFVLFIAFAVFAVSSVVILLGMEAFSSLLHAIRLMWVEFSSKFYSGMGYEFLPVSAQKYFNSLGFK